MFISNQADITDIELLQIIHLLSNFGRQVPEDLLVRAPFIIYHFVAVAD